MDVHVGPVGPGRLREPRRRDGALGPQRRQVERRGGDAGAAPVDQGVAQDVATVGVAVDERPRQAGQAVGDRRIGPPGQQRRLGSGELPLPRAGQAAPHGDQRAVAQRRPPRRVHHGDAARPLAQPVRVHRGEGAPHRLGHRLGGTECRGVHERQDQPAGADRQRGSEPGDDGDRPHGRDLDRTGRLEHDGALPPVDVEDQLLDGRRHVPAAQRGAVEHAHGSAEPPFERAAPGVVGHPVAAPSPGVVRRHGPLPRSCQASSDVRRSPVVAGGRRRARPRRRR